MDITELATSVLRGQRSTPGLVADTIRLAILRGQLLPGQVLRQEELAKQFGLSRVPVREALRQLEAEGLIVSYPHRGAVVTSLTAEEIEEVYTIRRSLETTALRLAVPRMSDLDLRRAATIFDQAESNSTPAHMAELNWAFHESLYVPAKTPRLLGIIKTLHNHAMRYHQVFFAAPSFKSESQRGHQDILEACRAGNAKRAVTALDRHLSDSCHAIVSYVRQSDARIGNRRTGKRRAH